MTEETNLKPLKHHRAILKCNSTEDDIRLPTLNLPTFDGSYDEMAFVLWHIWFNYY